MVTRAGRSWEEGGGVGLLTGYPRMKDAEKLEIQE